MQSYARTSKHYGNTQFLHIHQIWSHLVRHSWKDQKKKYYGLKHVKSINLF